MKTKITTRVIAPETVPCDTPNPNRLYYRRLGRAWQSWIRTQTRIIVHSAVTSLAPIATHARDYNLQLTYVQP